MATKIKITKNVVHNGVIHQKDAVVSMDDKHADHLVKNEFAVEHVEPKKSAEETKAPAKPKTPAAGN